MELASISIKQLFGKYDYKLDLTRQTTILVGANGVGKTTILKILYFASRSDWLKLRPYVFKEIIFEYVDIPVENVIKRSDLFPSITSIKNALIRHYDNTYKPNQWGSSNKHEHTLLNEWLGFLSELKKKGLLYDFLSDCYLSKTHSYHIVKVINQFLFSFSDENTASRLFSEVLTSIELDDWHFACLNLDYQDFPYQNTFYIDMVQKYIVSNRPANEPAVISPLLKWFSLTDIDAIGTRRTSSDFNLRRIEKGTGLGTIDPDHAFFEVDPIDIKGLRKGWVPERMLGHLAMMKNALPENACKEMIRSIDDYQKKEFLLDETRNLSSVERHPEHAFLVPLIEKSTIEINSLINKHFYSEEFVIAFNKRALNTYSKIIDKGGLPYYQTDLYYYDHQPNLDFFHDPEVIDNYIQYFNPILVEGNPFKFDIRKLALGQEAFDERYEVFIEFYYEELPALIDEKNKSAKIQLFEELLSKYSQFNQIKTTPSGLLLQDIAVVSTKSKRLSGRHIVGKSVDLGSLSSGEKKIILMLALAIFVRGSVLLIDEPELSLSLVWQELIIPDLINRTGLHKIIVATHSPFIASDESLASSIVYLPQ